MLETQIKELTAAIKELTETVKGLQLPAPPQTATFKVIDKEAEPANSEQPEQPEEEPTPTLTHAEVKSYCLDRVKADRSLKDSIKAILSEHGAKKIDDLAPEKLDPVFNALKEM